ncbi:MAG: hypothetical protein J0I06_25430 [Planctomycetes bacterium]|nr:hypothetical protein [Planctomycetota bacterium]
MSLANPYGTLVSALRGRLNPGRPDYLTPDQAHAQLVRMAWGMDYGYDAVRWVAWLIERGYLREGEYTVSDDHKSPN